MAHRLEPVRDAFARQAWVEAYQGLAVASREALDGPDLERLAVAAYLIGHDDESVLAWEDAHRWYLDAGEPAEAARCSFWLALALLLREQIAQAGGWLSRTASLAEAVEADCPATGYLLIPGLLGALSDGDATAARDMAVRATEIGKQFGDPDLLAFGTLGHGQALIALGDTTAGTARLDEVMLSVTAGEVGPITSGIVYCAVILECMKLFDLPRASEWTHALTNWCDAQPDLVPFRGQCLVHRSQLQQAAGEWMDASTTVASACQRLTDPPHPALGLAHYQGAELHRCSVRSTRQKSSIDRPAVAGISRCQDWPCSSWPAGMSTRRRPPFAGPSPRPRLAGTTSPAGGGGRHLPGGRGRRWFAQRRQRARRHRRPLGVGGARGDGNPGDRHRGAGRGRTAGRVDAPAGGGRRVAAVAHAV